MLYLGRVFRVELHNQLDVIVVMHSEKIDLLIQLHGLVENHLRRPRTIVAVTLTVLVNLVACGGGSTNSNANADAALPIPATAPTPVLPPAPLIPVTPAVSPTSNAPSGYKLVWADEFATDGLPDSAKWNYDTEANRTGWYNNELQYYAPARLENSRVSAGKLIIAARKEALTSAADYGGQAYTSARLVTRDRANWTYGFFEVRAKLPCGRGTWPAIWMLGTSDVPHPANGEIDIMEQVGKSPASIEATIYTAATGAMGGGISAATKIGDACTAFHNYQMTWTIDAIVIGVDNQPYFRYDNPTNRADAWPFDKPQYLILNLAIGGDMGGPVDNTIFPVQMEVEHVRVYQKQ